MISKNQIKLIRSLDQKKQRRLTGLFVAEGPKVVGDLLRAGYRAEMLFATTELRQPLPCPPGAQSSPTNPKPSPTIPQHVVTVTDDELRRISFLQHPQQVLAVMHIPDHSGSSATIPDGDGGGDPLTAKDEPLTTKDTLLSTKGSPLSTKGSPLSTKGSPLSTDDLALALDGVQDPGNLGTIIRVADWFGIQRIFCSPDTADCWNPKVVQATMGSLAHVHITYCSLPELLGSYDGPVYGTLLDGRDIYHEPLTSHGIIVMGNEGNGISPAVRALVNKKLLIPNFHRGNETAESLNVAIATAITCSEFRRRG